MSQTHIHLVITHLPVFGSLLSSLILAYGIWAKSDHTKIVAYLIYILSAIGAGIAYLTGEAAEETIENIQGVAGNMIEQHEDFAVFALVSFIILGISSIVGLFLAVKKSKWTNSLAIVIILISLIGFGLVARTAYLGGQIRHTEVSNPTTMMQEQNGEVEEDD